MTLSKKFLFWSQKNFLFSFLFLKFFFNHIVASQAHTRISNQRPSSPALIEVRHQSEVSARTCAIVEGVPWPPQMVCHIPSKHGYFED
jgi:hypothetical protein